MIKKSAGEKTFDIFNIIFMLLFAITIIFPFWQQMVLSVSSVSESMKTGLHLFTTNINFRAYQKIFSTNLLINAYYWTIIRVVVGTVLSLIVTAMLAYPLSKKHLPLRNTITGIIVFTMFFSGGLIPSYFLVRDLRLIDTVWALILPMLVGAFNVLLIRNFFMSLPDSLEESAKIDGAKDFTILFRIMLPLSKPIMATVALWMAVAHWNAWFDALIYMNTTRITVVQIYLRRVLIENQMALAGINSELKTILKQDQSISFTPQSLKGAILIVTTLPIILTYPFLQKYFVKGIMIGSLKG
jgi:putative aldouronate transport system permease protein